MKYDLFLSYNKSDKLWVCNLATDLEQIYSINCFFDQWDVRPGENIRIALRNALKNSKRIGFILSPNSISSGWVELETCISMHSDPSNRSRRIIPIYRITCFPPSKIPEDLAIFSYIDFRDDNLYLQKLEDLVREINGLPPLRRYASSTKLNPSHINRPSPIHIEAINELTYSPTLLNDLQYDWPDTNKAIKAFEVLIHNTDHKPSKLCQGVVSGCYNYTDGTSYSSTISTYFLKIRFNASMHEQSEEGITGIITEDGQFGREIKGVVTSMGHFKSFSFSFPIYLTIEPNEKILLRFALDVNSKLEKMNPAIIGPSCNKPEDIETYPVFGNNSIIDIKNNSYSNELKHTVFKQRQKERFWISFKNIDGCQFGGVFLGKTIAGF